MAKTHRDVAQRSIVITHSEGDALGQANAGQVSAGQASSIPVLLSTASVFPERTPDAFEAAARLGYDGVEVMVTADPISQDPDVLRRLSE